MEAKFTYPKDRTYVVGVSGGPDSMALLDLLYNQDYSLVVCMVNYHTRSESDYEQSLVKDFCFNRNIPFETIDVIYYKKYGNFEAWARDVRYSFFKECVLKHNAEGVFVAHHQDDLLETYLIQKHRKNVTKYFGLKEERILLGVKILRPLLQFTKKQLMDYCNKNNVPYSIDSTNLENNHLRNKIRNNILSKYCEEERKDLLDEIVAKNEKRKKNLLAIEKFASLDKVSINDFLGLTDIEKQLLIYEIITRKVQEAVGRLSWYRINELIKILSSNKPNVCIKIFGSYYFIREYNYFYVDEIQERKDFAYIMEKPGILNTKEFSCDFSCDTTRLKIYDTSYPLTFRNVKENDKVKIGEITKKVNRLLIEDKVPLKQRKKYPVVMDKEGKIVYIPLYRSETQKTIANKLKFMLK